MRLKCIATKVGSDKLFILGKYADAKNHYSITLGKEYIVFGLSFSNSEAGEGCFVQILSDNNYLIEAPLEVFEIMDNRLSKYWEFRRFSNGDVALWPPSFYSPFYHDDLAEDVPEAVRDFTRVRENILLEFL